MNKNDVNSQLAKLRKIMNANTTEKPTVKSDIVDVLLKLARR